MSGDINTKAVCEHEQCLHLTEKDAEVPTD